jgi:hypothetical protein
MAPTPCENIVKKNSRLLLARINRNLAKAAELLNSAAGDLRDAGLSPRDNIRKIGSALVDVYEVQHQIYRREPTLAPAFLVKALGLERARSHRKTTSKRAKPRRRGERPSRKRSI